MGTWKRFLLVAVVVKIRHGSAESGLRPFGSGRLGHFVYFRVSDGDFLSILLYVVPSSLCAYRQSSERRARAHREEMFNLNSGLAQGSALHLAVDGGTRSSLYPVLARAGVD
jgi:hypothetical protein